MKLAVLALIGLAWTSTVHAQPRDPRQRDAGYIGKDIQLLEIDDCPPLPPVAPDELLRRGAEHYQRGETLYLQGDYPAAVKEFIDAYCLKPDFYTILKDIGQAFERDLDYEKAIGYLERYVHAVPGDAKRASTCAPDPQVDKDNVASRIGVLANLRAQVLVQTDPKDATISLANDSGVAALGTSGKTIDVFGGHYQMTITKPGYETVVQPLDTRIGKPETVFIRLEAVKGRLLVRTTPGDARLFVDNNYVGIGRYEDAKIKAGTYDLRAEASGHDSQSRRIIILPDHETQIQLELFPKPQTGRRQAVIFATVAGATAAGSLSNAFDKLGYTGVTGGTIVGGVVGFTGAYFFMPDNIALGTSSLAITSTIVGYLAGTTGAALFTTDDNVITPLGGASALVAGAAGYYIGEKARIRPGDAAVINTGVVWGTAVGSLFAASFDANVKIGSALTLSGLGMGTIGGVLLSRFYSISRTHAALIDLGGIVGIIGGLATEALAYPTKSGNEQAAAQEHIANFAIGGLAIGLVGAGILTRDYDAPTIPVSPNFSQAQTADGKSTPTFGVGGTW